MKETSPILELIRVMAKLRAPDGCPWDREQDHMSLRFHAVEEVYELIDAIESEDESEMVEELGDLLLQVIFHCQLGSERKAFDFDRVCERVVDKLIRRHPHVFGDTKVDTVDGVWAQWEQIKRSEKKGTKHERVSALDGIPRHLPGLMYAEKLIKKARKAGLDFEEGRRADVVMNPGEAEIGPRLFELARVAQEQGWSAESLLRAEIEKREAGLRKLEGESRDSTSSES